MPRSISISHIAIWMFSSFWVLLISSSTSANTIPEKLNEYLEASAQVENFTGAVLISDGDNILLSKGYGLADIDNNIAIKPSTKFRLASITKPFTALAIMQLQEQGLLDVESAIVKYFPDYPEGSKITIKQLLSHTSGFANYYTPENVKKLNKPSTSAADIVKTFRELPLDFIPGAQHRYSNSGYILLGLIVEQVSGKPYHEYLADHIFKKLKMNNTGYTNHYVNLNNRASGYMLKNNSVISAPYINSAMLYSAGGVYSTTEDLYKFSHALNNNTVLSKRYHDAMVTPVSNNYAYGWAVHEAFGHKAISHSGSIDGFNNFYSRYLDDNLSVSVLSNNSHVNSGRIALILAAILFDKPYSIPMQRTAVNIESSIFTRHVATYDNPQGFSFEVSNKGGNFYMQPKVYRS